MWFIQVRNLTELFFSKSLGLDSINLYDESVNVLDAAKLRHNAL
jgi:hypothetical protein